VIESHIYVILTCDECGRTADYEDHDNLTTDVAEDVAIETLEWTQPSEGKHLCPECGEEREKEMRAELVTHAGVEYVVLYEQGKFTTPLALIPIFDWEKMGAGIKLQRTELKGLTKPK